MIFLFCTYKVLLQKVFEFNILFYISPWFCWHCSQGYQLMIAINIFPTLSEHNNTIYFQKVTNSAIYTAFCERKCSFRLKSKVVHHEFEWRRINNWLGENIGHFCKWITFRDENRVEHIVYLHIMIFLFSISKIIIIIFLIHKRIESKCSHKWFFLLNFFKFLIEHAALVSRGGMQRKFMILKTFLFIPNTPIL